MEDLFDFIPEAREIFTRRFEILEFIIQQDLAGRRRISSRLGLSERVVRDEIEFLRFNDLVLVEAAGVKPTKKALMTYKELRPVYEEAASLKLISSKLCDLLKIDRAIVVRGNVEEDEDIFINLGDACVDFVKDLVKKGDIIGVTGGRSLREVANRAKDLKVDDLMVVPARGSLGKIPMYQANTVAAIMAEGFRASYNILAVPDMVDEKTLNMLLKNEEVKEVYDLVRNIDILIFGLGRADVMGQKRGLDQKTRNEILKRGAVGEAFGHYFDLDGQEIYSQESFGISKEEFLKIKKVVAVAGGAKKAQALVSIAKMRPSMSLVTDEGLAREVLREFGGEK
ncbi:hypothetical protein LV469_07150 [Peptoniphilus sp. GNH]|nr:sugar-binding domain protein [Clostridiales bacterium KA00134]UHR02414.1 hypothetical protein LV469_07150 [Peptoniphilus sp. GNH]